MRPAIPGYCSGAFMPRLFAVYVSMSVNVEMGVNSLGPCKKTASRKRSNQYLRHDFQVGVDKLERRNHQ